MHTVNLLRFLLNEHVLIESKSCGRFGIVESIDDRGWATITLTSKKKWAKASTFFDSEVVITVDSSTNTATIKDRR